MQKSALSKIIFPLILLWPFRVSAQVDTSLEPHHRRNSMFLEFGGNAIEQVRWCFEGQYCHPWSNFSVNFERVLRIRKRSVTTFRIGTSIPSTRELHIIPVMLNLCLGKRRLMFEIGGGGALIFTPPSYGTAYWAITTVVGFRYVNPPKHLLLRMGITPSLGVVGTLWAGSKFGVSAGYQF